MESSDLDDNVVCGLPNDRRNAGHGSWTNGDSVEYEYNLEDSCEKLDRGAACASFRDASLCASLHRT